MYACTHHLKLLLFLRIKKYSIALIKLNKDILFLLLIKLLLLQNVHNFFITKTERLKSSYLLFDKQISFLDIYM